jgi:hypothetical protein
MDAYYEANQDSGAPENPTKILRRTSTSRCMDRGTGGERGHIYTHILKNLLNLVLKVMKHIRKKNCNINMNHIVLSTFIDMEKLQDARI